MCGIFGAIDFNNFEKLYIKNRERGNFAHGFMYIKRNGFNHIRRDEGVCSLTGEYTWQHKMSYDTFLGHTQAPTSAERQYQPTTSHPFETKNFVIAHNGVLENHLELADEHRIDRDKVKVDSQIIPILLDDMYVGNDVMAIHEVCNMLQGIFACWIYCKRTKLAYVVRSGCTLYTNKSRTKFSSTVCSDVNDELEQGIIYCYTPEGLTNVGEFTPSNPFFLF
jgi:glucosamine 6-phosphate synthetase-like amidotransferase/phosphosugar isomerase protein